MVSTESDASYHSASLIVCPYVNSSRRSSASRVVVLFQFWLSSSQTKHLIARTSGVEPAREGRQSYKSRGGRGRADTLEGYRTEPAPMTGGRRSRYLKTGGVIALVLFLLYLFSSKENVNVRNIVHGLYKHLLS